MIGGQTLLQMAFLLCAAALATGALGLWTARGRGASKGSDRLWELSRILTWLTTVFVTGAVLYMALSLLAGNFSLRYVWQYSATYEPAIRRLSALLAGQEGSFLVWTFLTGAVALWSAQRYLKTGRPDPGGAGILHVVLLSTFLALLFITMRTDPFESFTAAFPQAEIGFVPVEGMGLNPVLRNSWMVWHTLLTFIGYALATLAGAVALVQLAQARPGRVAGAAGWQGVRTRTATAAWLALSLSLITGIMWAYEEMTFGWFWSWDPVESATLVIWFVLTAALHAGRGRGRDPLAAPGATGLAVVAIFFAAFVTRSGLHPSVHAFATGGLAAYLGGLLAAQIIVLAVFYLLARRRLGSAPAQTSQAAKSDPGALPVPTWGATAVLLSAAAIVGWGISYPIVARGLFHLSVELDPTFFNISGYLLALATLLLMGFGLRARNVARRTAWTGLAIATLLTLISALVKPLPGLELLSSDRSHGAGVLFEFIGTASVLSLFPPLAYVLYGAWSRWWSQPMATTASSRSRETGLAAVHASFALCITGLALSSALSSTVTFPVNPMIDGPTTHENLGVELLTLARSEQKDRQGMVVEQRERVEVAVFAGGSPVARGFVTLSTFPERNGGRHPGVFIHRGLLTDTQVIYRGLAEAGPRGVPVTVRRIPAANLLWGGLFLLVGGGGALLLPQLARTANSSKGGHAHGSAVQSPDAEH